MPLCSWSWTKCVWQLACGEQRKDWGFGLGTERERERERDVCTSSRGSVCACARCQLPVSARVSRHRAQVSRIQAAAGRGCPEPVATASSILLLQGVFLFPSLAACFLLRFLGWRGEKSGTGLLLQPTLLGFNAHSFQDCVHLLHVVQVALDLQAKRSLVSGEAVGNPAQFHPLSQKPPSTVRFGFSSEKLKERGLNNAVLHGKTLTLWHTLLLDYFIFGRCIFRCLDIAQNGTLGATRVKAEVISGRDSQVGNDLTQFSSLLSGKSHVLPAPQLSCKRLPYFN